MAFHRPIFYDLFRDPRHHLHDENRLKFPWKGLSPNCRLSVDVRVPSVALPFKSHMSGQGCQVPCTYLSIAYGSLDSQQRLLSRRRWPISRLRHMHGSSSPRGFFLTHIAQGHLLSVPYPDS